MGLNLLPLLLGDVAVFPVRSAPTTSDRSRDPRIRTLFIVLTVLDADDNDGDSRDTIFISSIILFYDIIFMYFSQRCTVEARSNAEQTQIHLYHYLVYDRYSTSFLNRGVQ